jgi:hypothetical protein
MILSSSCVTSLCQRALHLMSPLTIAAEKGVQVAIDPLLFNYQFVLPIHMKFQPNQVTVLHLNLFYPPLLPASHPSSRRPVVPRSCCILRHAESPLLVSGLGQLVCRRRELVQCSGNWSVQYNFKYCKILPMQQGKTQ